MPDQENKSSKRPDKADRSVVTSGVSNPIIQVSSISSLCNFALLCISGKEVQTSGTFKSDEQEAS